MEEGDAGTRDVRNLFLQSLALIYFISFLSVYLQSDGKVISHHLLILMFYNVFSTVFLGLYGSNGVTPIKAELKLTSRTPQQCLKEKRTLLCLIPSLFGINSGQAMELLALLGVLVSSVA